MLAQIASQLSAGIRDAGGPMPGFRVQHDVRGFDTGRGQNHHLGIDFHFPPAGPVDVRDALRRAVLVNQDGAHQGIGK